jgi:hypothetical protein
MADVINIESKDMSQIKYKDIESSWAELVAPDMSKSISDKILINSGVSNNIKNDVSEPSRNNISISEILVLDLNDMKVLDILEYQSIIVQNLKKYIKQCNEKKENIDIELHMPKFQWLDRSSNLLAEKLQLQKIIHRSYIHNGIIARSSYKFCEYSHECEFNYPKNKKKFGKGCYKQHFVHNYLNADINSIIEYIKNTKNEDINYNEINKCMKTIDHVINNMKDELENLKIIHKDNYDKFHKERSIYKLNFSVH